MERFAELLDDLYFTNSTLAKETILSNYLRATPDPDRGWALAAIAGTLSFDLFKRNVIKSLMMERMDPFLFDMSRHYVGEMSETVALAWPKSEDPVRLNRLPSLHEIIEEFQFRDKAGIQKYLITLLDNMSPSQRWALLKLGTRGLRIGMSARSVKQTLAKMKGVDVDIIEAAWHGLTPPYLDLFAWLDGTADLPDLSDVVTFSPVMLAHPIDVEKDLSRITPQTHQAEWKWDGIRVQVAANGKSGGAKEVKIFSRKGEDISGSFPDLIETVDFHGVIDGELLVKPGGEIGSFNDLQQRLNKKKPAKTLMKKLPAHVIAYDLLDWQSENLRQEPLSRRRELLKSLIAAHPDGRFALSETLVFENTDDLVSLREEAAQTGGLIEGLMIKDMSSVYVSGRPKHAWYKWKRDPFLLDAVLMYARRGTGKRSSFYSDYTFGLWGEDGTLLPIGKAYFGFTDEELKKIDNWVRSHKLQRFGPVQEVEKELVFEVAFDAAQISKRHKSGYALRFPRIHRIRWDKPAAEADKIVNLAKLVGK
ncbi:Putative ATP dependent DNA ligase [Chondrus crispus]|uniref:Putative ATP dependent DNA ligase n=1 Tax=Chondrus crispus TaxID=2769 RepID=R7QQL7_CHOCR|nr:Putative ATP dependent DNA ligase [Chondrus crispus]CDF40419.1 Putative ATP dependent DNA ligase [Chondrus crispus]|eukprot:XP_005710713.1 Putative ATP dependent DNA ligase [Chondrus crispus]